MTASVRFHLCFAVEIKMAESEGFEPPWRNGLRCFQNSPLMTSWITLHGASLIGYFIKEAMCCQ